MHNNTCESENLTTPSPSIVAAPLPSLGVRIISVTRLFPETAHKPSSLRHIPLSMLDATAAYASPTSAVWLYDPPPAGCQAALTTAQLTLALQTTLNVSCPQLAGQLQWAPYKADGDHTMRFGRLYLSYGSTSDPGMELVIAHCPSVLSSLVPSPAVRAAGSGMWDARQVPLEELLPTTPLAPDREVDQNASLPCAAVQLTTFDCGGMAIVAKFPHSLADAQTLLCFMHHWAAINRSLLSHAPLPTVSPLFDPLLLDRAAAGDIDAATPDPALLDLARALPMHRYDVWASADGFPPFLALAARIPPELDRATIKPLGPPLPWNEWDVTAPVAHQLIHFSADEVHRMWEEASLSARVSHLDALVSHVWALIIRARELDHDEVAYLNVSVGVRSRLCPPLPDTFLGSSMVMARVTTTGEQGSSHSLRTMAASIRSSILQFNPSTLPALLHDIAHQDGAQRMWPAFFGRRNTIATSWLRLDVWGLDFGGGAPQYVEAVMPKVDGCIQVMEAGHGEGMRVSLHLREDVMQKLLKDQLLRKYSSTAYTTDAY